MRILTLSLALTLAPLAALAEAPAVGTVLGTDPATATAALGAAGCPQATFDAEGGKIEAKCTDTATGKKLEIYIDPKTGAVTEVKSED